jgi:hypothetical protein
MANVVARSPDDGDEPIAQPPVSHIAILAIIAAVVLDREPRAREHPLDIGEIERAMLERPGALRRVEADPHPSQLPAGGASRNYVAA